ncbi:FtsX-like permease family protein [Chitinophaga arvensicola]|uniref:ABC-type antimicrobial peptide transport system, permease component n=1 Tax=Chitinophaga arvensicola TaxID=29529 RepID=A0A1I0SC74_9BACT|nr:FtsX-like permease family protein [Chitinophaga arvensicola]SEW54490.1 ABC-type antimicrobial peptide transport system, permease component [Chitinophaga arvensicola]
MLYMYLKIAWRNIFKSKISSFINIIGLATGMAVVLMIGMWIADELNYNKTHLQHDRIVQVMRHTSMNGKTATRNSMAIPLKDEMAAGYGANFQHLVLASPGTEHVLLSGNTKIVQQGRFMEPGAIDLLSLKLAYGNSESLKDPGAIFLSRSAATALFGNADPMGKTVKIDNSMLAHVVGVYADVSYASDFRQLMFVASWNLLQTSDEWAKKAKNSWSIHSYEIFAALAPGVDINKLSASIRNLEFNHYDKAVAAKRSVGIFLFPMDRWHLFSEWKDGVNTGGRIHFVWLFGIIGVLGLLLACINFMNLTTARAEKRAKEVGIRKAVGSRQGQLIRQFFTESLLLTFIAFTTALLLTWLLLPLFNELADKKIIMPWNNALFWLCGLAGCIITGLLAGSYPALYLSSFRPVKVLKGTFRAGRYAAVPRKVLVVLQFTVSVILMVGTLMVYQQVQYAKDRPVGYSRDELLTVKLATPEVRQHFNALRESLQQTGVVVNAAASEGPTTDVWDNRSGFSWTGKDPGIQADFATIAVTPDYGATVGLTFTDGRDFSADYAADSLTGIVVNESAAKFMGMTNAVGQLVTWGSARMMIIGVVKDMIMTSPYEAVKPAIYYPDAERLNFAILRINPGVSMTAALAKIAPVFAKYNPDAPFDYQFVDQEYARKFDGEERIGKLAGCFAVLTIFISCIGLFGLSSFIAQQRTKEIGIRKVMGASVFMLWKMLSGEFLALVSIAGVLAVPVSWHFLDQWLQQYAYHVEVTAVTFVVAGAGALLVTFLTVSYQAIVAATANPVKSLRAE